LKCSNFEFQYHRPSIKKDWRTINLFINPRTFSIPQMLHFD
jgi:hypothetical protein